MLKEVLADKLKSEIPESIKIGEIGLKSFIQKDKNNNYNLVILDKFTSINGVGFCYKNSLPKGKEFKIQFFKMNSWSVMKNNDKYYSDTIRSYYAKPVQLFTEWGAGHILVKKNDGRFSVSFPKAITTSIPTEKIRETVSNSKTGVYLKQLLKSYPLRTDFYIPAFSTALNEYVCELSGIEKNKLIFQEESKRDTISLATYGSFFPIINVADQVLEKGKITYRTRILNKAFYCSKHWMLFFVWLVLTIILFLVFPKSGIGNTADKVKDVRWYICGVFTLFWFFLNQKLLIAEKLTFTYPYFEKIFPVTYLTTLFSLFSVFMLILLINKSYLLKYNSGFSYSFGREKVGNKLIKYKIWLKLFTFTLIIGISTFAVYAVYKPFVSPVLDSYCSKDFSGLWEIWQWQKMVMLNDNHFTVFMIVGVLLFVLLIVFLLQDHLIGIVKNIKNQVLKINQYRKNKFGHIVNSYYNIFVAIVYIFVAIVYVFLYFIVGFLGNFGTSIAMLILLISLSIFLQKNIEKSNDKPFLCLIISLLVCCVFVIIGMSDFGFLINIFGIVFCWIILILSSTRYSGNTERWKQFGKLLAMGIVFCALALLLTKLVYNPENIDYERSTRRIQNCIDPGKVKDAGYIYTESDMQWMEIMRYYAEKVNVGSGNDDDIYGEDNDFHQLVSSGQSPVILNDLCVPGVYLGSLRSWGLFGLLFGILAMGILVFWFSIGDTWRQNPQHFEINRQLIGRLLAANLWIGVTLYLLASYYWLVPFTGRLIPGFAVDAVGEYLEIIVLFAFMCTLSKPNKSNNI